MSEQITAACVETKKEPKKNKEDAEIVSIGIGRLLKLKYKIEALKKEALGGYAEELKDIKSACNHTNALLGELNDGTRGNGAG